MLDAAFLQVVKMSYTASYVIVAVLLARLLLKRAPKSFSYGLWSVALFRLVCPWSFESALSLFAVGESGAERLSQLSEPLIVLATLRDHWDVPVGGTVPPTVAPAQEAPLVGKVLTLIWLLGIAAFLLYSIIRLFKLKRQLRGAVHDTENIYLSANLCTPFVMRVIRPRIYLPLSLSEAEKRCILEHERTHIRRLDPLIKLVSFMVLCVHWFNPLVWAAFFLSGRDMEMSCDEAVIRTLGNDVKKEYSSSLLSLSTGRRVIVGTPLAFGEGDTKSRIKNVLNYRKPPFWFAIGAIVLCGALAISLITNPPGRGLILVDGILYKQSGNVVRALPPNTDEIGTLDGILHARGRPEKNLQGVGLDETYAGNRLYRSGGDDNKVYLEDVNGFWIPFVAQSEPASQRYVTESVHFYPADAEDGNASSVGPFAVELSIPDGWTIDYPVGEYEEGSEHFRSHFLTEVHLYHDGVFAGQMGFHTFEPYEQEVSAEDYYKTVYPELRLGRMYKWEPYTPVNRMEISEAAVVMIHDLDEATVENHVGALAGAPATEVTGILAYDKSLEVYVGIQFAADVVTELEAEQIARSMRFVPIEQDSAASSRKVLVFFVKPDEPAQVIGETAAGIWLKSYKGEEVSPEERIADYTIQNVTVIVGDPKEGQKRADMEYHYAVRVEYEITTASDDYDMPEKGISGKGTFRGLVCRLMVKALEDGQFVIVSVITGDGESPLSTQPVAG